MKTVQHEYYLKVIPRLFHSFSSLDKVLDSSAGGLIHQTKFRKLTYIDNNYMCGNIRLRLISHTMKLVPCHTSDTTTNDDIRSDLDSVHIPSN